VGRCGRGWRPVVVERLGETRTRGHVHVHTPHLNRSRHVTPGWLLADLLRACAGPSEVQPGQVDSAGGGVAGARGVQWASGVKHTPTHSPHTHAHTRARTHTRTHAYTRTHTPSLPLGSPAPSLPPDALFGLLRLIPCAMAGNAGCVSSVCPLNCCAPTLVLPDPDCRPVLRGHRGPAGQEGRPCPGAPVPVGQDHGQRGQRRGGSECRGGHGGGWRFGGALRGCRGAHGRRQHRTPRPGCARGPCGHLSAHHCSTITGDGAWMCTCSSSRRP
jgi:hypothetical protein